MQHIYVLRHGQSQENAHKVVSGSRETPLTELGKQQARLAGEKARSLGIDLIVCSPMSRARETAFILADSIGYPKPQIVIVDALRERVLGELEGTSYAHHERLNGNYPETEKIPGIEPLSVLHGRVQTVLRQLLADKTHHNILIVCHMNVGRMLQAIVDGHPPGGLYNVPRLKNGDILTLI